MYKRLLIPLDGSQLAESILPVAVCLEGSLGASIELIHVIEKSPPKEVHGDPHLHDVGEAEEYLTKIAKDWFGSAAAVRTHVHTEKVDDVPGSILQHVEEFQSDLTLMCTHGSTGAREFLYGSIAQQIAAASVPVLFIRAKSDDWTREFGLDRILVPLDGDTDHEQGLYAASGIAKVCDASMHLVTVIPNVTMASGGWSRSVRLLPGTTDRMLSMEVEEAASYLDDHRERLATEGLDATIEVARGNPAEQIVRATTDQEVSLTVLGTHGTVGAEAFWSGSVVAKVARRTITPVLLVPARIEKGDDR